jgi:hypothetical protein
MGPLARYHKFGDRQAMLTAFVVGWAVSMVTSRMASAAPPQAKFQAPGFYRLMLGDYEVTVLSDGTATREVDEIMSKPHDVRDSLAREHRPLPVNVSIKRF